MYDAVVVEVCDGGKGGSHEVGGIGLVVVAFPADAVKQLSTKREISYEVDCMSN